MNKIYVFVLILFFLPKGWIALSFGSKFMDGVGFVQGMGPGPQSAAANPWIIASTLRAAYPRVPTQRITYYALTINNLADRAKLDWSLIAAIIWVESQFNPAAKSPMQAKGIMQLLEGTAEGMARKMGITYYKDKTLWDDATNLKLGVQYLQEAFAKEKNARGTAYYYLAGPQWRQRINQGEKTRQCMLKYAEDVLAEKLKLENFYGRMAYKEQTDIPVISLACRNDKTEIRE